MPDARTPGKLEADTIVALATPPGRGALGVIRLSGPDAGAILLRLAPGLNGTLPPLRTARLLALHEPVTGELLDRGLVTWFPAPGSYTGEDSVELSVHGGSLVPALVKAACERAGAREARAGEFTQRAYLNGKVDLVQAEAVRDLVEAETEHQRRAALHQAEGGLSRRLSELRERLVHLEALLVYHVDFPDEDEPPVPLARIVEEGGSLVGQLERLVATAPEGELLREGALAVLAGRPNSGKSSLFNALLGHPRAIVTDQPGTTRDAIEAGVSLGGFPFRLVDTAGIREEAEEIERLGIEVARRYLDRAAVVLLCSRADEVWGEEEEAFLRQLGDDPPVVVLRTMRDRVVRVAGAEKGEESWNARASGPAIEISAEDGTGLDELRRRLPELLFSGLIDRTGEEPLIMRRRQREGLEQAKKEVADFVEALRSGLPAEVAGTHLRAAETALEQLLGVISGEEVLDRVFSDFCIGK